VEVDMKNMSRYFVVALSALALIVMLSACAKEPTQEMTDAKAAIDAAVAEGGEKYAKDEVKALNDQITAAQDEIKAQEGKFFKKYDKAKEILAKVKTDAEALKTQLPAKKEKAKTDATAAVDAAKTAVAEAKALLSKAPRGKGTKADIEALKADVAGLEDSLKEVDTLMTNEEYFGAIEKAESIKTKAGEVSTQINEALAKKATKTEAPAKKAKKAK